MGLGSWASSAIAVTSLSQSEARAGDAEVALQALGRGGGACADQVDGEGGGNIGERDVDGDRYDLQ